MRSPSEFAQDHVPGACNLPVLSDAERAQVGALHAEDAFAGRRLGAALMSGNICRLLREELAAAPRQWRPLVYCWRGGQRSRGFAIVLREIGWRPLVLQGGYRAYRSQVRDDIARLCPQLRLRVLTGLTGVGKTRLLRVLASLGEQVLDLEELAAHRGSLLGDDPACAQPSQKMFESRLWERLGSLDLEREVFIEGESRRIGRLFCPDPLWQQLCAAPAVEVQAPVEVRVSFLMEDYSHFLRDPAGLQQRLEALRGHHPHARIDRWQALIASGEWAALVRSLLQEHYDPRYASSQPFAVREQAGVGAPDAAALLETAKVFLRR